MKPARALIASPRVQRLLYPAVVALVLLGAWQALATDWQSLGGSLLVTLKVTVLSFAVAVVVGVLISFVFVQSRVIETALFPYAVLLQVTPIVAVAPLIIVWIKDPTASMVICASLVAL